VFHEELQFGRTLAALSLPPFLPLPPSLTPSLLPYLPPSLPPAVHPSLALPLPSLPLSLSPSPLLIHMISVGGLHARSTPLGDCVEMLQICVIPAEGRTPSQHQQSMRLQPTIGIQRSMMLSKVCVGFDSCPSYYIKIVYFGQTSSSDDVVIIPHRCFWYARWLPQGSAFLMNGLHLVFPSTMHFC